MHVLLIILLLLPLLSKVEKEDLQGILIAFGDPEAGMMEEATPQENSSQSAALPPKPISSNDCQKTSKLMSEMKNPRKSNGKKGKQA